MVCADAKTSSVVIAIRGSMSLRDVVTDMCLTDESLLLEDSAKMFQEDPFASTTNGRVISSDPSFLGVESNSKSNIRVHRGILNR